MGQNKLTAMDCMIGEKWKVGGSDRGVVRLHGALRRDSGCDFRRWR